MKKAIVLICSVLITFSLYAQRTPMKQGKVAKNVPTLAYITEAGHEYYDLGSGVAVGPQFHTLSITWDNAQMTYSSSQATGIFTKVGNSVPFLTGKLHFYVFNYNPDPGHPIQEVNRLAIIGEKRDGSFGFIREFDYLGGNIPTERSFEVLLNGINNSFVVLEAGSPTALK